MSSPLQRRRARVDAAMNVPPTVAEQTAEREAQTAAALAETGAAREGRNAQLRADPEWQRNRAANYPVAERN